MGGEEAEGAGAQRIIRVHWGQRWIRSSTQTVLGVKAYMGCKICQQLIMQFIVAGKGKTTKRAGK